jgi:pyroglutamyl-peptidase
MKLVLTGFEPFGRHAENPSEQTVHALQLMSIAGIALHTLILPVDTVRAPALLLAAINEIQPDVLMSLGEARGRAVISIERVAINLLDFERPDNSGITITDAPIVAGAPAAYLSTLPVRALRAAALGAGVPATLSLTAGAYLCNQVMFAALHHIARNALACRAGFVHLPALPASVAERASDMPSMSIETTCRAVRAMLEVFGQSSATIG